MVRRDDKKLQQNLEPVLDIHKYTLAYKEDVTKEVQQVNHKILEEQAQIGNYPEHILEESYKFRCSVTAENIQSIKEK